MSRLSVCASRAWWVEASHAAQRSTAHGPTTDNKGPSGPSSIVPRLETPLQATCSCSNDRYKGTRWPSSKKDQMQEPVRDGGVFGKPGCGHEKEKPLQIEMVEDQLLPIPSSQLPNGVQHRISPANLHSPPVQRRPMACPHASLEEPGLMLLMVLLRCVSC